MILGIVYKMILLAVTIKSFILGRKFNLSAQNYLLIYLCTTLIVELISFSSYILNPDLKNGLLYNLYNIFSFLFFYNYFRKILNGNVKKISFIITATAIIYVFFFTRFTDYDFDKKIGITLLSFYIIHSLLWFYQKIIFFNEYRITDDPAFWISTALLMWSCFFVFRVTPMFYFAKEDKEFLDFLRDGQNIINIIMYTMFYISLLKYEKLNNESR